MQVVMRMNRVFQDAGQERPLQTGEAYELPDVIAQALVATGAATMHAPVKKPTAAPERKPAAPPETK